MSGRAARELDSERCFVNVHVQVRFYASLLDTHQLLTLKLVHVRKGELLSQGLPKSLVLDAMLDTLSVCKRGMRHCKRINWAVLGQSLLDWQSVVLGQVKSRKEEQKTEEAIGGNNDNQGRKENASQLPFCFF